MIRSLCYPLLFLFILQSTGCAWLFDGDGYFRDRTYDYKAAKSVPRILVLEDTPVRPVSPKFEVPGQSPKVSQTLDDIPMPPTRVLYEQYGTSLKRVAGAERLTFDLASSFLPIVLEQFLAANEISVDQSVSETNLWITEWDTMTVAESSTGFWKQFWHLLSFQFIREQKKDYFRLKLGLSEQSDHALPYVDISYQKLSASRKPTSKALDFQPWQFQSAEEPSVSRFLNEFVTYVADYRVNKQKTVRNSDPIKKSLEIDGNGYPVLVLGDGFASAWENLQLALLKSEVAIDDLDRSLGVYYIKIIGPLARLSGVDEERYDCQVRVIRTENGVLISIQESDEKLVPKRLAVELVNRLHENY